MIFVIIHLSTKGNFMFIYNSFKSVDILDAVNAELSKAGSAVRAVKVGAHKDNLVHLHTSRGAKLVAHLWSTGGAHSAMTIRAIHRIVNKNNNYKIMINGQAISNLKTLVFNGENGDVYLTDEKSLVEYVEALYDRSEPEHIAKMVKRELEWASHYNHKIKSPKQLNS